MPWDKLELHIENLIPGLVTGGIIAYWLKLAPAHTPLPDVLSVPIAVTTLYLLGTLSNVFSRLALDAASKYTFRPVFIYWFGRSPGDGWQYAKVSADLSKAIDAGLSSSEPLIRSETAKRRVTGRLVRSALVPVWTSTWLVGLEDNWPLGTILLTMLAGYFTILALYSYAEVALYREGKRALRLHTIARATSDAVTTRPLP